MAGKCAGSPYCRKNLRGRKRQQKANRVGAADFETDAVVGQPADLLCLEALPSKSFGEKFKGSARQAKPDIIAAVTLLASYITKWNENCDRKLILLYDYLHTHRER